MSVGGFRFPGRGSEVVLGGKWRKGAERGNESASDDPALNRFFWPRELVLRDSPSCRDMV
jgi:hypothetical protein